MKNEIQNILNYLLIHNGWNNWYDELIMFRKQISKYIYEYQDKNFYKQHRENYHMLGYYAPLDFKVLGFEKQIRTPAEQLIYLASYFKKKNIRFIYVPIPCKLSIYPELYVNKSHIPNDMILVPQWQKFVFDLLVADIEVFDLLPLFLNLKKNKTMLYTESFFWSPYAVYETAYALANYLQEYKKETSKFVLKNKKSKYKYSWFTKSESWLLNNIYDNDILYEPYYNSNTEIAVFGDCNIYEAMPISSNISSVLAYFLQTDIQQIGRHTPYTPQLTDTAHSMRSVLPSSFIKTKCVIYFGFISDCYVKPSQIQTPMWNTLGLADNVFNDINLEECLKIKYEIDSLLNTSHIDSNIFEIPNPPVYDKCDYTNERIQLLLIQYIKQSGLFDEEYYKSIISDLSISPIEHYVKYGALTKNPAAWFNTEFYLKQVSILYHTKMNPLYHFLNYGLVEKISPRIYNSESLFSLFTERLKKWL